MPSRRTVLELIEQGCDHDEVARRLGISPGLSHLLATGVPADGGDSVTGERRERPGYQGSGSQRLVGPRAHNLSKKPEVLAWVRERVGADEQMRSAGPPQRAGGLVGVSTREWLRSWPVYQQLTGVVRPQRERVKRGTP